MTKTISNRIIDSEEKAHEEAKSGHYEPYSLTRQKGKFIGWIELDWIEWNE